MNDRKLGWIEALIDEKYPFEPYKVISEHAVIIDVEKQPWRKTVRILCLCEEFNEVLEDCVIPDYTLTLKRVNLPEGFAIRWGGVIPVTDHENQVHDRLVKLHSFIKETLSKPTQKET